MTFLVAWFNSLDPMSFMWGAIAGAAVVLIIGTIGLWGVTGGKRRDGPPKPERPVNIVNLCLSSDAVRETMRELREDREYLADMPGEGRRRA